MTILSRESVLAAYARALALNPDPSRAIVAVAQSLVLPVEVVAEVVADAEATV